MATETFIDANNVERIAGRLDPPVAGGAATISAVDPGAIGAGLLWLDTSTPGPVLGYRLRVRNATDTGWEDPIIGTYDSGSGDYAGVQVSGASASMRGHDGGTGADVVLVLDPGTGIALSHDLGATLASTGFDLDVNRVDGAALHRIRCGDDGGDPTQTIQLDASVDELSLSSHGKLSVNSATFSAFGVAGSAQPVVPLTTPDVQDVIDALVALGWVAQHD